MSTLLSLEGTLTPRDSKTVRSFAFFVPPGTEAMTIVFEWDPYVSTDLHENKRSVDEGIARWTGPSVLGDENLYEQDDVKRCLEKLSNLLNTVLVEPSGRWRGRTDRGKGTRARPLVVDPAAPGFGFHGGRLEPGSWRIDLEVHAVVSPSCTFFLEVKSAPASAAAVVDERPARAAAFAAGPGWFKGDLHTHTLHSDGRHTVGELTRRAKALGLDFLALTDHNCTAGKRDLADAAVPVVLGAELTTFRGHHVVLGLDEMLPWHEEGRVLDINEVVARVKAKGALFTLTHPYNLGDPICTGCRWMTPELDVSKVDLVEIWHRRWSGDSSHNAAARALWDELWKQGHRPVAVAVRDWHSGDQEDVLPGPLPCTVVGAASLAPEHLLEGLRAGRVYVTRGPSLDVALTSGASERLSLGERGPAGCGDVSARVVVAGLTGGARLSLLKKGDVVAERTLDGDGAYELFCEGGEGWYRVELWDDEAPLAITNHVELVASSVSAS